MPVSHRTTSTTPHENPIDCHLIAISMVRTKDCPNYQEASRLVSTLSGSFLIRTIKTWGNTGG